MILSAVVVSLMMSAALALAMVDGDGFGVEERAGGVPGDPIMPAAGFVQAVREWAAAAFAGAPQAGAERLELELRRQDHGPFMLGRSCMNTPLRIGQTSFAHGLGTHAGSEIAVALPPQARRFRAQVGVDNNYDTRGQRGSVQFAVERDGREVLRTPTLRGGQEPAAIDLELPAGTRELVLKVDPTEDGAGHDQADWADAHLVLADGGVRWLDELPPQPLLLRSALPFSFRYGGRPAADLLAAWPRTVATAERPEEVEHRVAWTDPETGLCITAVVTVYLRFAAVDWVLHFENQAARDTPILEDIQALDVDLRTGPVQQPAVLHQIRGDTGWATTFLPFDTVLEPGGSVRMAPAGGRSSSESFPFMNLQAGERGLLVAIGWTGAWAVELSRRATGATTFRAGLERTHLRLHPGERIRSPRILLLPWSGGLDAAHNRFRRLMLAHYVPQEDGRPVRPPVALQCFDRYSGSVPEWATEAGQIRAAEVARQLGCDTLWLDAAWFVGGFPHGVGNWVCKPAEFPHGLAPVSAACHARGLKFMLWFEPERVAAGTQIAQEHPDFVFGGAAGGLFRLDDPQARRWLTDLLSSRIREYGVDIFRNDFNIEPLAFWRANDTPDRQGMTEIRYVEGLYAMWDELRARHPGLLIDNCASGGRRIDIEMCRRSLPLWRSDTGCAPRACEWNQVQCHGLSLYVPCHAVAGWTPAPYDVRSVAAAGVVCQWDYLDPGFPLDLARASVAEARANQEFWLGDFYPLLPASVALDQWAAYQLHRPDLDAGVVFAFRRGASAYAALAVGLRGLRPAQRYAVEFVDEQRAATTRELTGAELMSELELRLPGRGTSLLLRYRPAAQP